MPNVIRRDDKNNSILTTDDDDIVFANGGDDDIFFSIGNDQIFGGSGTDTYSFSGSSGVIGNLDTGVFNSEGVKNLVSIEVLAGSKFGDVITGSSIDDVITGLTGVDFLYGGLGNDTLRAGGGKYRDLLFGGPGDDTLQNNSFYGGAVASYKLSASAVHVDTKLGVARGEGNDRLIGIKEVEGSTHADTLISIHLGTMRGGSGADTLSVASGSASLYGENDNDTLYGGSSSSGTLLDGGRGVDFLYAGEGAAEMYGGIGNDTLVAGDNYDDFYGGSGGDRFVFRSRTDIDSGSFGSDIVYDFRRSEADKFDLSNIDPNTTLAGDQAFRFVGTGTLSVAGDLAYEAWSNDALSGVRVLLNFDNDSSAEAKFLVIGATNLAAADFTL